MFAVISGTMWANGFSMRSTVSTTSILYEPDALSSITPIGIRSIFFVICVRRVFKMENAASCEVFVENVVRKTFNANPAIAIPPHINMSSLVTVLL